jgi:hypothetical protein
MLNERELRRGRLTASKLRQTSLQKKEISLKVQEILLVLDQEILEAHNNGENIVSTTLPFDVRIDGMSNKASQREIWSRIIEDLENRDFKPSINPTDTECKFIITWLSSDAQSDIDKRIQIIAEHTNIIHLNE